MALTSLDSLIIWALAAVFLCLKMHAISLVQGYTRLRSGHVAVQEDANFFGGATNRPKPELLERGSACWRNDLENIPIFLLVALGYALLGGTPMWLLPIAIVFCAGRTLHTVSYLLKWQPWRTVGFITAALAMLLLCALVVLRVTLLKSA